MNLGNQIELAGTWKSAYHRVNIASGRYSVQITDNTVVQFHYTLRDESGEEHETSRGGDPTTYLHGSGNIVGILEKLLAARAAGDVFSTTLSPEEGYGERNPERQQRIPIKHLMFSGKLKAGMVVHVKTREGTLPVTVLKVGRHSAEIDANHPIAGRTVTFDIEVIDVREASAEEVAHGHPIDEGEHHH